MLVNFWPIHTPSPKWLFFHISWGWILSTFIWKDISASFPKTIFCWVKKWREFLGDPVVKTLCSHCQGPGFNPLSGNYDPTKWVPLPKGKKKELDLTGFFFFFFSTLFFIFKKIFIGVIVHLKYYVTFRCTAKWICYTFIHCFQYSFPM